MSRVMFAVFAFMAMVAVGSAIEFTISAGNGQDTYTAPRFGGVFIDSAEVSFFTSFDMTGSVPESHVVHSVVDGAYGSYVYTNDIVGKHVHFSYSAVSTEYGAFSSAGEIDL
jgi:hypothetical protein